MGGEGRGGEGNGKGGRFGRTEGSLELDLDETRSRMDLRMGVCTIKMMETCVRVIRQRWEVETSRAGAGRTAQTPISHIPELHD